VNADQESCNWKKLLWPIATVILGALVSINPFYAPQFTLEVGIAVWVADMALVLICLKHPITGRLAILVAGLCFAVPCFLRATPLARGLLMCCMAFPFAIAVAALFGPPTAGFRARLAYFFTWLGTQKIEHRARSFDAASLFRLITATAVFSLALACAKTAPAFGFWLLVRWLAGGIMIFAFAEIATMGHDFLATLLGLRAPALMRSPFLSTSVGEFWAKRWNVAASALWFRPLLFSPLARYGVVLALFAAFFASAVGHLCLAYMATVRWKISIACGAFFLVQPLLILAERRMKVHRWPTTAARVWTLSALAITSPLFVEPAIGIIAPSWGAKDTVLTPTMFALGFAIIVNVFFLIGQLVSCPGFMPSNQSIAANPARTPRCNSVVNGRRVADWKRYAANPQPPDRL
jgi:hypothetical protein